MDSVAPTTESDHVPVPPDDHVVALVQMEHLQLAVASGSAAGSGVPPWVESVHLSPQHGVVGEVHVGAEGEGALAGAVVGGEARGGEDPILFSVQGS